MKFLQKIMFRTADKILFLTLLVSFSEASNAQSSKNKIHGVLVATANGKLEGRTLKSGVHTFKGVPYAAPPVGNLRWKAPQVLANWTGVKEAINFWSPSGSKIGYFVRV